MRRGERREEEPRAELVLQELGGILTLKKKKNPSGCNRTDGVQLNTASVAPHTKEEGAARAN